MSFPLLLNIRLTCVPQTQKDIPVQLLASTSPLSASLVLASFGESKPYNSKAFNLVIKSDTTSVSPTVPSPLRYGKLPEIHHIFKADAKSPPKIISLFFTAIVVAALPALYIVVGTLEAIGKPC